MDNTLNTSAVCHGHSTDAVTWALSSLGSAHSHLEAWVDTPQPEEAAVPVLALHQHLEGGRRAARPERPYAAPPPDGRNRPGRPARPEVRR